MSAGRLATAPLLDGVAGAGVAEGCDCVLGAFACFSAAVGAAACGRGALVLAFPFAGAEAVGAAGADGLPADAEGDGAGAEGAGLVAGSWGLVAGATGPAAG